MTQRSTSSHRSPRPGGERAWQRAATVAAAWTSLLTAVSRASQLVSQLVLAWLLVPEDFGVVGLAYTVMMFVWLLRQAGIMPWLIQRERRLERWAGPAGWMSLAIGLASAGATAAAAPWVGEFYRQPRVVGVLWVLALGLPLESLAVVPRAALQARLRFRPLALIDGGGALGAGALSIALAWWGWGVYSFVLPRVVVAAVSLPLMWSASGLSWRRGPAWGRWKYLAAGMGWITAGGLAIQLINQGDYIVLGRVADEATVGRYYLAFMIASQTMTLLTVNLGLVLMPALSRYRSEPARQAAMFMKFQEMMAVVAVPLCLTLSVCAEPLVAALLGPAWSGAGPMLAWLAAGMAFRMLAVNTHHYLQAAGRWAAFFWLNLGHGLLFIVTCAVAWRLGGVMGMTRGVAGFFVVYGLTQGWLSLPGPAVARAAGVLRVYGAGLVVTLPGLAGVGLLMQSPWLGGVGPVGSVAWRVVVMLGLWLAALRWARPREWERLRERAASVVGGRGGSDKLPDPRGPEAMVDKPGGERPPASEHHDR